MSLAGKRVVVGVGGGIAAFKAVELVREIGRRGGTPRVVMTGSATRFVGPMTFTGITGHAAVTDLWDPSHAGEVHVELGAWADAMVIAPATMNLLARGASGMADDPVLATVACMHGPVVWAPAMHSRMWAQPATRRNVEQLRSDGGHVVEPVEGPLASGESGMGRMAEAGAIADALERVLAGGDDLEGKRLLITAGPTAEDLDPVRYVTNRSSGRMGFALAERAAARGGRVTLVSGPVALTAPAGVEHVPVRAALEMKEAIDRRLADLDAVIMAAAVADYRPATRAEHKIRKGDEPMAVELVRNPDILAELGAARQGSRPVLVGFALETDDPAQAARRKLADKRVDLVVGNLASVGFGGERNEAVLVGPDGDESVPEMTKRELADRILDRLRGLLSA